MNPEQRLTPKQAAELAGVHVDTIRKAYRRGDLVACRNHGPKIRWAELERWMNRDPIRPEPQATPGPPVPARRGRPARGSLDALNAIEERRRAS